MATTADELSPLQAYNLLMVFASRYGENTLRLALHAALPQVLRTDLLHLLRLNFVPESMTDLDVKANVLFAPFCQDLGNGYYRFDQNVRLQLLQNLDPAYAEEPTPRSVLIARFLLSYIEQQSRSSDRLQDRLYADYLEVERWGALGFLDPEVAAAQLAAALQQATSSSEVAVRIRVAGLATALSTPLARYGKLLAYAAGLEAMETGKFDQAKQLLESLDDAEIEIGKIRLKSPQQILRERLQPPVETTVTEEEDQDVEPKISETTRYFDSSVAIEPTEMRDGKPVIRYFVSYAHQDKVLKDKLLKSLKQHLAIVKDYTFEAWDDKEILVGERWHKQIQAAIARCQFGLLLISPAFLGSNYIRSHELPPFVAGNLVAAEPKKLAIPVALERIPFDSSIDLKGLERLQVFRNRAGKAFQECRTSKARGDFASELFQHILKIVKRYGTLPSPNKGRILWFNDDRSEMEPYTSVLREEGYLVTNVTTVTEANSHLVHHHYDLLILNVAIPTRTHQEEEEYPPDITYQGRKLGLQFYIKNKDKLENQGTQVLVITKQDHIRDKFIKAGLPKEYFCTAFQLQFVEDFMDKVNTILSRVQSARDSRYNTQGPTILWLDNDLSQVEPYLECLRDEGFSVTAVSSNTEAES